MPVTALWRSPFSIPWFELLAEVVLSLPQPCLIHGRLAFQDAEYGPAFRLADALHSM